MAVVLLEFDRLDGVGRTVALAGLVVLSAIAIWAYVQTIRTTGEPGMESSPAQAPEPAVEPQSPSDSSNRSGLVQERLVPRPNDPQPEQPTETLRGNGEPGRTTADPDPQKERVSTERDAASGRAAGTGATAPEPGTLEPSALDPSAVHDSVVEAWRQYLRHGDGHFNVVGLRRQFSTSGLQLSVADGARVQAREAVLLVEGPSLPDGRFLVVPNFMKSPRAAPGWFADVGDGALTRRTKRVHRLGVGEWTGAGFRVIEKGRIE